MKNCKDCNEYTCGGQGTDNISNVCGGDTVIQHFDTGAIREDKTGKGRCDLLPMCALIRLSKHFEAGTKDHPERNWEKGMPIHGYMDSAIRHIFKYMDGRTDEDHLCAAAWNILCAMWTEEKLPEMQDIPARRFPLTEEGILDTNTGNNTPIATERKEDTTEAQGDICEYAGRMLFGGEVVSISCFYDGDKNPCECPCNGNFAQCSIPKLKAKQERKEVEDSVCVFYHQYFPRENERRTACTKLGGGCLLNGNYTQCTHGKPRQKKPPDKTINPRKGMCKYSLPCCVEDGKMTYNCSLFTKTYKAVCDGDPAQCAYGKSR